MSEDKKTSDIMSFRKIGLLLLMFIIFFIITPYSIHIRNTYSEIHSLLYWLRFTIEGMTIDAPFPSENFSGYPSTFLWFNLLQICFVASLLLHYRGMISRRYTSIAGRIGLVTGILSFIMNGIGTLLGGYLIIVIPVPIPTLIGLAMLLVRPRPEKELWLEEPDIP